MLRHSGVRVRLALAVVRGRSMHPTLHDGDRLLVAFGAPPRPGDVLVVLLPGRGPAVKRALRRDGAGWWVERDNPHEGVDSWLVGAVPTEDVLGRVLARMWPRPGLVRRRRR